MRAEQHVGHDGLGHQVGTLLGQLGLRMRADIGVGPAVEPVAPHLGQVIGHQPVAQPVAFVDRDIQVVGAGVEGDADRIAQAAGEGALAAAVGGEFLNRRARRRFFLHVAARADRDIDVLAVWTEGDIPRPVPAGRAEGAFWRDSLRLAARFGVARLIRNPPKAARVRHIEETRPRSHAVRLVEPIGENRFGFGPTIAIHVAQQPDLAAAQLRREDVAVGRDLEPAHLRDLIGENLAHEPLGHDEIASGQRLVKPGRIGGAGRRIGGGHVLGVDFDARAGLLLDRDSITERAEPGRHQGRGNEDRTVLHRESPVAVTEPLSYPTVATKRRAGLSSVSPSGRRRQAKFYPRAIRGTRRPRSRHN